MKRIILVSIIICALISCRKNDEKFFTSEKESIDSVVKKYPQIGKNLEKIRRVDLDSLSITLYKIKEKEDFDEILLFRKNDRYYAIPFFSNMYFDFWGFKNEKQIQIYPKTNTTFEKELIKTSDNLNLTIDEFYLIFEELTTSILHTEIKLNHKPQLFQNYVYGTYRNGKHKIEQSEECIKRTSDLYNQILMEQKESIRYNRYYLDNENGRVYELINTSRNFQKSEKLSFKINIYRIDCFSSRIEI